MRIVLFHPVLLPPKNYGGVERFLLWLAKGLVERGHEVWIATFKRSQLPAGVMCLEIEEDKRSAWELLPRLPDGIDVVHFLAPPEQGVMERLGCPSLVTVSGQGQIGEKFPRNTVFLTRNHAQRHGAECFVYYGLDPEEYLYQPEEKKDWFLFLSKTSWKVKNLSGAIRYANQAGVSLKIAGGERPYLTRLRAMLSSGMSWEGAVGGHKKNLLLAHARGFLFPIVWPEPFGIVVIEALVSGTPVIASRRGSLSELVSSQVGVLVEGYDDQAWVRAIRASAELKPEDCREYVLKHFHYSVMSEQYEKVYKKVISGQFLNTGEPVAGDWRQQQ